MDVSAVLLVQYVVYVYLAITLRQILLVSYVQYQWLAVIVVLVLVFVIHVIMNII